MNVEELVAAQQRRLKSKPPKYNKDCVVCEERAYEMLNVLDALEDNLTTVLEIYRMLAAGELRMEETEEAVSLLDVSLKSLESRLANIESQVKEAVALAATRENNHLERIKPALDLVTSVKWAKWAIIGTITVIGTVSAVLTQLPLLKIIQYFLP